MRLRVLAFVVVVTVFACDRPDPDGTSQMPSASATASSTARASVRPLPYDWETAVSHLRKALEARGVNLVFDTELDYKAGCDGGKLRKLWRTGVETRLFDCKTCTPITKELMENTALRGPAHKVDGFARAVATYSTALMKKTELETVRLCGDLFDEQKSESGALDPMERTVMLAVSTLSSPLPPRTFHHEMMHVFDQSVLFGVVGFRDEQWLATNDPGFQYGQLGPGDPLPKGILTHYSSTRAAEDRAEVFAEIMVRPAIVCDQMRSDERLLQKMKIVRSRLKVAFGDEVAFVDRLDCPSSTP